METHLSCVPGSVMSGRVMLDKIGAISSIQRAELGGVVADGWPRNATEKLTNNANIIKVVAFIFTISEP